MKKIIGFDLDDTLACAIIFHFIVHADGKSARAAFTSAARSGSDRCFSARPADQRPCQWQMHKEGIDLQSVQWAAH